MNPTSNKKYRKPALILFSLILIMVYSRVNSWGQSIPHEQVLVRTDRNMYLCGEKIYFAAWTYEGNWIISLTFSSVLYFELYNQDNLVISRTKLLLKNGTGSGCMDIPRDVSSGIYYLRAYTNYMKNFGPSQFYVKKLKLVNPFYPSGMFRPGKEDLPADSINHEIVNDQENHGLQQKNTDYLSRNFNIRLSTDKGIYENREEVEVSVTAADNKGFPVKTRLWMSVVLSGNDTVNNQDRSDWLVPFSISPAGVKRDTVPIRFLPEIYGDIISGKLIYEDGKPAGGIEILQSFTGPAGCIESAKSDRNGIFHFITENERNKGDLVFCIPHPENKTLPVPGDEFSDMFPAPARPAFMLTKEEKALLARQYINVQVEDAYAGYTTKTDSLPEKGRDPFYGNDYSEYLFADYARLPNMKEFIFEVIVGVIVLKENRIERIAILDVNSHNDLGPDPLMLVDGVPVKDASVILGINPEKVRSVRVVRSRYFYKKQIFDGILDILTYEGDAKVISLPDNTFRYNFVHAGEMNEVVKPVFGKPDEGRIPVYKNLLYWNSSVETDAEGKAGVTFYTPDNTGLYSITCFGFTMDGMTGEGRTLIRVGEK